MGVITPKSATIEVRMLVISKSAPFGFKSDIASAASNDCNDVLDKETSTHIF